MSPGRILQLITVQVFLKRSLLYIFASGELILLLKSELDQSHQSYSYYRAHLLLNGLACV